MQKLDHKDNQLIERRKLQLQKKTVVLKSLSMKSRAAIGMNLTEH
jgi:hypothetical protein